MKKYFFTIQLLVFSLAASAQYHYATRVNYDIAIPTGQFSKDFISQTSFRGFSIDNRWEVKPDVTVGFNVGWQVFSQKLVNFTEGLNSTTTVNGTQFRYINTFPIQLNTHYYFGEEYETRAWAGLSIGTAYTNQLMEVGFLSFRNNSWSFALTPQVGVDIPIYDIYAFTLSARYNYFMQNKVDFNYSFLNIGVGFKFIYY